MIRIIKIFLPLLVYLAIAILNSSAMSDITTIDWFDNIIDSADHSAFWGKTEPLFPYEKYWAKEDKIVEYVVKHNGDDTEAAKLVAYDCIHCLEELMEIKNEVKKGEWFKHSLNYITGILKTMEELWLKTIKGYFRNGKVVYYVTEVHENKNKRVAKDIQMTFGPWVIWGLKEWDRIIFKWKKQNLRIRFQSGADPNAINPLQPHLRQQSSPSDHHRQGRPQHRSYSDHREGNTGRSRSRDYGSSYSPSRHTLPLFSGASSNTNTHSNTNTNSHSQPSLVPPLTNVHNTTTNTTPSSSSSYAIPPQSLQPIHSIPLSTSDQV